MKRKQLFQLAAAVIAVAIISLLTACKDNNDEQQSSETPIEEKILGNWITTKYGDSPAITEEKVVVKFVSPTKCLFNMLMADYEEEGGWVDDLPFDVTIKDNVVTLSGKINEHISAVYELTITKIDDKYMECMMKTTDIMDGETYTDEYFTSFDRLTTDYKKDLVGTWETLEQEDNTRWRYEFKENGTFSVSFLDDEGEWVILYSDYAEYSCDCSLLSMRWMNIGESPTNDAWEISYIRDGTMQWTALRMDDEGNMYTEQVQLKKI